MYYYYYYYYTSKVDEQLSHQHQDVCDKFTNYQTMQLIMQQCMLEKVQKNCVYRWFLRTNAPGPSQVNFQSVFGLI